MLLEKTDKKKNQQEPKPYFKDEADSASRDHEMSKRRFKKVNLYLSALISPLSPFHSFFQQSCRTSDGLDPCQYNESGKCSFYPPFTRMTVTYISHVTLVTDLSSCMSYQAGINLACKAVTLMNEWKLWIKPNWKASLKVKLIHVKNETMAVI